MNFAVPLLSFCAWGSGAGKTTLLTKLIPELAGRGLKVSVIKHAHHSFDIDHPGKDSYRLREAGAVQTMLGSRKRWALMTELSHIAPEAAEPSLAELLPHLDASLVDLVLVEGFRQESVPKIEVHRPALGYPLLAGNDPHIIAIATDGDIQTTLPVLNLNSPATIADFVVTWVRQSSQDTK